MTNIVIQFSAIYIYSDLPVELFNFGKITLLGCLCYVKKTTINWSSSIQHAQT